MTSKGGLVAAVDVLGSMICWIGGVDGRILKIMEILSMRNRGVCQEAEEWQ